MSELTNAQWEYIKDGIDKKIKAALENGSSFGLDKWDCERYLNVQNDTRHRPACNIEKIEDEKAYIRAVFFGSGILSHPVRHAWVPLEVIRNSFDVPLSTYYFFKLKNFFFKPSESDFTPTN